MLTNMYNALEKLRARARIEGKDREIYDQGLIGILRDLHDHIATAAAYGWPLDLSDDDILHRLVALNAQRAGEEARGQIRRLRVPNTKTPKARRPPSANRPKSTLAWWKRSKKAPWPKTLPEQISSVQAALRDMGEASPDQIASRCVRARAAGKPRRAGSGRGNPRRLLCDVGRAAWALQPVRRVTPRTEPPHGCDKFNIRSMGRRAALIDGG